MTQEERQLQRLSSALADFFQDNISFTSTDASTAMMRQSARAGYVPDVFDTSVLINMITKKLPANYTMSVIWTGNQMSVLFHPKDSDPSLYNSTNETLQNEYETTEEDDFWEPDDFAVNYVIKRGNFNELHLQLRAKSLLEVTDATLISFLEHIARTRLDVELNKLTMMMIIDTENPHLEPYQIMPCLVENTELARAIKHWASLQEQFAERRRIYLASEPGVLHVGDSIPENPCCEAVAGTSSPIEVAAFPFRVVKRYSDPERPDVTHLVLARDPVTETTTEIDQPAESTEPTEWIVKTDSDGRLRIPKSIVEKVRAAKWASLYPKDDNSLTEFVVSVS